MYLLLPRLLPLVKTRHKNPAYLFLHPSLHLVPHLLQPEALVPGDLHRNVGRGRSRRNEASRMRTNIMLQDYETHMQKHYERMVSEKSKKKFVELSIVEQELKVQEMEMKLEEQRE